MAYNSPYTGAQVDSAIDNVTNGTGYTKGKTPSGSEVPPNNAAVTYGYLASLLPWTSENGGINKYSAGETSTATNGKAVHPLGYIFEWSNKKADGTAIPNAPDLTTPTKVAQYFGYGTWELYGVGRVTVGIDTNDADFDSVAETGGYKGAWYHNHTQSAHSHSIVKSGGSGGSLDRMVNESRRKEGSLGTTAAQPAIQYSGSSTHGAPTGDVHKANLQPYIVIYRWIRVA